MPTFDLTITTGNVLEIIGIISGGMLFLYRVCARLNAIEAKLEERIRVGNATDEKVDRLIDFMLDQKSRLTGRYRQI